MLLVLMQTHRELIHIVHPHVVSPVVHGAVVSPSIMHSFIALLLMYGAVT